MDSLWRTNFPELPGLNTKILRYKWVKVVHPDWWGTNEWLFDKKDEEKWQKWPKVSIKVGCHKTVTFIAAQLQRILCDSPEILKILIPREPCLWVSWNIQEEDSFNDDEKYVHSEWIHQLSDMMSQGGLISLQDLEEYSSHSQMGASCWWHRARPNSTMWLHNKSSMNPSKVSGYELEDYFQ